MKNKPHILQNEPFTAEKKVKERRLYRFYNSTKHGTYRKDEFPGEVKGKKAIRAAKREKVKALKAVKSLNEQGQ